MTGILSVTPEIIASTCNTRLAEDEAEVVVLWVQVPTARVNFEHSLRGLLADVPAAVVSIRQRGFDDPNSLLIDLVGVLDIAKSTILTDLEGSEQCEQFALVLLAKTPLSVAQAASPIHLPEWFPRHGNRLVSMLIEDVTWTASAPLNCAEAKVDELCLRLYGLEDALTRRLALTSRQGVDLTSSLSFFFPNHHGSSAELAAAIAQEHQNTRTPSGFRPSIRLQYSLISQLWKFVRRNSPEELTPASTGLSHALNLPTASPRRSVYSLASVLSRPISRSTDWRVEFSRSMLHQASATCQFTTAAAHSDAYGQFPVQLLVAYSYDLRRWMNDAETLLNLIDD